MKTKIDQSLIKHLDYLKELVQPTDPAQPADEFAEVVKRHMSTRPRTHGKCPPAVWEEVIYP